MRTLVDSLIASVTPLFNFLERRPPTRRRTRMAGPAIPAAMEFLERRQLLSAAPVGDLTEGNAAAWTTFASDNAAATASDDATHVRAGAKSLLFDTQSGFDTGVKLAAPVDGWDLTTDNLVEFWAYGNNNTPIGWQGNQPIVVLQSPSGSLRLQPNTQAMSNHAWTKVHVPFAGDAVWQPTVTGTFDLSHVMALEIHQDTWDAGFQVYYDGLQFANRNPNDLPPAGPPAPDGVQPDAISPKVLLYVFDPIMENLGSQRQHAAYGWDDPQWLAGQMVSAFEEHSHHLVHYQLETVVADEHPYFVDGFQHTDESFTQAWAARDFHNSQFDYVRFANEHNIAQRIDSGEIDEVWLYAGPINGTWESCMGGQGAYWINGPTQPIPSQRAFPIMGLNFEAGLANALHSFGHRVEGTLDHIYGGQGNHLNNNWDKFTFQNRYQAGLGGIGNVHFPVNGTSDYDYANQTFVTSNADDWSNYPNFQGTTRSINAQEWANATFGYHYGYMTWWYDHMPHFASRGPDFRLNNWWRYIVDLNQFKVGNPSLYLTEGQPVVKALTPTNVFGTVEVDANAFVDGALGRVDFYVDGVFQQSDALAPFTFPWDTSNFAVGAHVVTLKAYDLQNQTEGVSPPVTVRVNGSDPPVIGNFGGDLAWTENAAPLPIAPLATVTDSDSANFGSGKLTVKFSANGQADDRLTILPAGGISLNTATQEVLYGGTVIGTYTGGVGTTPLVITFKGTATTDRVQALLQQIAYSDVSENPATAARTIWVQLLDGDTGLSLVSTKKLNVQRVNDAPVIGNFGGNLTFTENGAPLLVANLATVADVDSTNFDAGTLTLKYTANGTGSDRLAIRNQGTAVGQIGTNVTDPATNTGTVSFTALVGGVATPLQIGSFTGGIGTTPLVVTLNANALAGRVQSLLRNVTYQNVSENPSANPRTLWARLTDGDGGTSLAVTKQIAVTPVIDKPVIGSFGNDVSYTAGGAALVLATTATVTDIDSPNLDTGKLVVKFNSGAETTDRLEIRTAGNISVNTLTKEVLYAGTVIGTYTGGTGLTALAINFNTAATAGKAQALLRNITYRSVSATPSTTPRVVQAQVFDGDGGISLAVTKQINVSV